VPGLYCKSKALTDTLTMLAALEKTLKASALSNQDLKILLLE
jgi:hypothetical protein